MVAKGATKRIVLLIDGQHYDATAFKHPGGSIIKFLNSATGSVDVDASNAFREFHARSSKARIVLATLPKMCLLIGLSWSLYMHPRHIMRTRRVFEALCCAARYVGWFAFMRHVGYSWLDSIGALLVSFALACTYIFVNFAVSHTHLPVTEADEHLHWIEYSALHTTNVDGSAFVTWWMSNLNFQIEHHLFPTMPQFRHPLIAPRVMRLFAKHGLPYDSRPYTRAIRDTFANLRAVGKDVWQ
jgi:fatty acid desaturase 2 (delta-6 desaturase)